MKSKYTKELLEPIVKRCLSFTQVLRELGLKESGGNHSNIKVRIIATSIDYSHFLGNTVSWSDYSGKKNWEEHLIKGKHCGVQLLRRCLLESGREHKCEWCLIGTEWNGKKLVLQIDHINGDNTDNQPHNLRFLCPNCHSQTENWSGKGSKHNKIKQNLCIECQVPISNQAMRCRSCTAQNCSKSKIKWPSIDELQSMIAQSNFSEVGCRLGVSDNAVRKHLRGGCE